MKPFLIILSFLILVGYVSEGSPTKDELPSWEKVDAAKSIEIYDRFIPFGEDKFIERKGVIEVDCSSQKVFELLCNTEFTKKWMKGILFNETINSCKNNWEVHTIYAIPWPFEKRELFSMYQSFKKADDSFEILIKSIDEREPSPNCQTLKNYRSSWQIVPVADQKSQIILVTFAAVKPLIPEFIQYPIILSVFKGNLVRLKELIENQH